ncbi:MAG: zinc-ribbon domain-containing protein [Promethearchaeota archaeon]
MPIAVFQRCPRCGNENPADSYTCSFCGKRLKIESIENFFLFRRIEADWFTPLPWYMKIYYLFRDPPRAFHDINHKRSTAPGYIILLLNSLLWGFMGLAFISHFTFSPISAGIIYALSFFIVFFIFGFLFNLVFFTILTWLFSKGANYAVGFSERLEARFGGEKEKIEFLKKTEMSPFSIYKGGTLLQKQQAYKYKMLFCAFAPLLLINTVKILVILAAFPNISVDTESELPLDIFSRIFKSQVWAVLDVIDALTIAIWVPILMALAIRDLSNSSTLRVLISSLIIGTIVAILFYFLRPTLFGS